MDQISEDAHLGKYPTQCSFRMCFRLRSSDGLVVASECLGTVAKSCVFCPHDYPYASALSNPGYASETSVIQSRSYLKCRRWSVGWNGWGINVRLGVGIRADYHPAQTIPYSFRCHFLSCETQAPRRTEVQLFTGDFTQVFFLQDQKAKLCCSWTWTCVQTAHKESESPVKVRLT